MLGIKEGNQSTDPLESGFVRKLPKGHHYTMRLPSEVKYEETWVKLTHFLRELDKQDSVEIECSGYGGSVQFGSNFLNALSRCKASDKMIRITGDCWSMHALIAAFMPEHSEIDDLSHLMFHNMSHISWGKVNETIDQAEFYKNWMPQFLTIAAGKILTKSEINGICKGEDIYLSSFEYKERQQKYLAKQFKNRR